MTILGTSTSSDSRSTRLVLVYIISGTSTFISQLSTGYIIEEAGYAMAMTISMIYITTSLLMVNFMVSDSTPSTDDSHSSFTIVQSVKIYVKETDPPRRMKMLVAMAVLCMVVMVEGGSRTVQTTYKISQPLCFTSVLVGYHSALQHIYTSITGLLAMFLVHPKLGDMGLTAIAALSMGAFYIMLAFSTTTELAFIGELHILLL